MVGHINNAGGLYAGSGGGGQTMLAAKCIAELGAAPGLSCAQDADMSGDWWGAQATVQRWYADPLLNNAGEDRTIRTVFTHDHFGPSTHQQAGLYAGLVVETSCSQFNINPAR